jgi:hypothetical protein
MKISSSIQLFIAALVGTLTVAVVAKAAQTVTVPNAATITYVLAPGANSGPITPVANQAVFMMGSQTTIGFRGVAMATILHVPSSFIEWVGLESTAGAAITQGFSGAAGTHILFLDFAHQVDVQVASTDTIRIHNGAGSVRTGNLELIAYYLPQKTRRQAI